MPPSTTFHLRRCTPTDVPALSRLNATCFTAAANSTIHASVSSQDRLTFIASGFYDHFNYPTSTSSSSVHPQDIHILCIMDTETNEMISHAIWTYFPNGYRADADIQLHHAWLPPGINKELLGEIDRKAGVHRSSHPLRGEAHWLLATLGTHPAFEGKGAGRMLIRWGLEKADEKAERCFVDSSLTAEGLYRKFGFEVEVGVLELGTQGEEGNQRWVGLMREAKRS